MRARAYTPAATMLLAAGCAATGVHSTPAAVDAPPMRLVAYDSCDDLAKGLRAATEKQVTPYGLDGPITPMMKGRLPEGAARAPGPATEGDQAGKPADHSTTNNHEAGADEPDLVKTDGKRIVTLSKGELVVIDAATRKVTGKLKVSDDRLPGATGQQQLLLSGDRALVLTKPISLMYRMPDVAGTPDGPGIRTQQTTLTTVDLTGTPKVTSTMKADGDLVDARQTGSVARVVVKTRPRIDFPQQPVKPGPQGQQAAIDRNKEVVRKAPVSAWLPKFTVGGKSYSVQCDQVSRPASYTGTTMLNVLTLDLSHDLGDPQAVSIAADGETVYGTGSSLYITGTPPQPLQWGKGNELKGTPQKTDVHKFDVRGTGRPRYVASGSVPGSLLNQYSISEYGGNVRLATTTTPMSTEGDVPSSSAGGGPASQSAVYVLGQRGPQLSVVGKLDGLGKGERIYSVRFIGTAGYVVTFRQVDPLYVLDLSDAAHPRSTGELKITGYSAYLHPMADGRLLGVGQDADDQGHRLGTQVSLFDVAGGTPKKVGSYRLPGTSASTDFDPHAFLYWPQSGLAVVPVSGDGISNTGAGTGEALVLKIDGNGLHKAGTVHHPGSSYENSIQRSLVVGNTLWTISDGGARATDVSSFHDQGWLRF
ncbi:beta-propeller domain-containing protein [Actinomadura barringtoniae]|uniref:Beta-propeller domain-containing protein n=1 Tax=Actinomadura barringtoniae TaxID=1427535 RepID=A0A939PMB9_9ACTN|nr:beta-propeller domain-containing protein [Actinomadura barringtoniae]MBO2454940.1 beta-propeller domain-containing protein [Actinomadura barringtoniae]